MTSLTFIVPEFFLPLGSVSLGRFITSLGEPRQNSLAPSYKKQPDPSVSVRESYVGVNSTNSNTSFGSTMLSFVATRFSKRVETLMKVTADVVQTYTLDNSDDWFSEAMGLNPTRVWVERALDRGDDIYMIVGYHTMTNANITHQSTERKETNGHLTTLMDVSIGAVRAVAPAVGVIDNSMSLGGGGSHRIDNAEGSFSVPGENICALQYRKLHPRWLSSKSDNIKLSRSPRWSSLERSRDDEDGEDDIIEVEATSISEVDLEGKWEREEAPDGEVILMSV